MWQDKTSDAIIRKKEKQREIMKNQGQKNIKFVKKYCITNDFQL